MWLFVLPFVWFARPTQPFLAVGGMLVLVGLGVRAWAAGQLEKNKELAVSGPYAHTRNPLYLGSFLIGIGVTVAGGLPLFTLAFLVFFVVVYWKTMDSERAHLTDQFGDRYRHYRNEVPRFFPRLRPYKPTPELGQLSTRFSFDQYFENKEWEAALGAGLAFVFLAFRAAGFF